MNNLFASLPYIGDLFYHHMYLFYEEPQIFFLYYQIHATIFRRSNSI